MKPTWEVHTVHSKAQLMAAIGASAQPGRDASATPVCIRLGSTRYTFSRGITEDKARGLLRRIRRTPAKAFEVAE